MNAAEYYLGKLWDMFKGGGTADGEGYALDSPAAHAAVVVPNNTTNLASDTRAIFVGGAGNINLRTVGGEDVLFTGVVAGTVLPIRARRIYATNTTATNMVAMW